MFLDSQRFVKRSRFANSFVAAVQLHHPRIRNSRCGSEKWIFQFEVLFSLKNISFLLANGQAFRSEFFSFSQQFSPQNSPFSHQSETSQVHSFSIDRVDDSPRHLSKWHLIVGSFLVIASFLTLILLLILHLFRPSTNDFIECDRVDTRKTSQSAPPPYEEIERNNAVPFGPTADSVRH